MWAVKKQTSRGDVRGQTPPGKFEKTWVALKCISLLFHGGER